MGENLGFIIFVVVALFFALITMGLILAKLYKRASKEVSYVRTGLGGQKVIMDGGSIVLPVLHEVIPVNMNTLRLEVVRSNSAALITKDRMRVDVQAEFYVRVKPTEESIADAAQTLGYKSMNPLELKKLVEGKFVDSLRAVAAEMTMEELHEQRVDFVARVQRAVTEDLLKNGLELETVSLTGLDQTGKEYFNPDNAFDAQGLTKLTEEVEQRRKQRNDIEQDTEVAIRLKNLEAEKQKLAVARDEEYARLTQQQEIELQRASQATRIAQERANKDKESRESQIGAAQQVKTFEIVAERAVEEERIAKEKEIEARQIEKMKAIETAEVERRKAVELAEQERKIAIAEKSKAQSESEAEADKARALAVKAQELVVTVRDTEVAERGKQIELIEAAKAAEREAIKITVAAQAEKKVAEDNATAVTTRAQGDADAERLRSEAAEVRYAVEAEGIRKRHEADNLLSADQIAMQIKLAIIENLSEIVAQCVKPIEAIEGIRIVQVDGLNGLTGGGAGVVSGEAGSGRSGNLAEEVVSSALRYRAQAPLLDSLLKDVGISTDSLSGLTSVLGEVGKKDKE
ncbi:MAG: flotillin domain-containing protein [bacterium]|nr:flotillin domain-containing protein [bacterium]